MTARLHTKQRGCGADQTRLAAGDPQAGVRQASSQNRTAVTSRDGDGRSASRAWLNHGAASGAGGNRTPVILIWLAATPRFTGGRRLIGRKGLTSRRKLRSRLAFPDDRRVASTPGIADEGRSGLPPNTARPLHAMHLRSAKRRA